jgi:hypothetical protein
MRGAFGLIGLLIALAIVGVLVKNQLAATRQAVPALQLPAPAGVPTAPGASAATVKEQSQQIQQQYKQAIEGAMQQPRPEPDSR